MGGIGPGSASDRSRPPAKEMWWGEHPETGGSRPSAGSSPLHGANADAGEGPPCIGEISLTGSGDPRDQNPLYSVRPGPLLRQWPQSVRPGSPPPNRQAPGTPASGMPGSSRQPGRARRSTEAVVEGGIAVSPRCPDAAAYDADRLCVADTAVPYHFREILPPYPDEFDDLVLVFFIEAGRGESMGLVEEEYFI